MPGDRAMTEQANQESNATTDSSIPGEALPRSLPGWLGHVPPNVQRFAGALLDKRSTVEKRVTELLERISGPGAAAHELRVRVEDARRKTQERTARLRMSTRSATADALSRVQNAHAIRSLELAASERLDVLADDLHRVASRLRVAATPAASPDGQGSESTGNAASAPGSQPARS
jgi:hypothetical protein